MSWSKIEGNTKECKKCNKMLPLSCFSKSKHGRLGLDSRCKECHTKWQKAYRKTLSKEDRNKYYKPLTKAEARKRGLMNRYGITDEDFISLLYKQDSKCLICLNNLESSDANVDHCHIKGSIRGILCRKCNLGLGHFNDNKDNLRRAIEYLDRNE